MSTESSVNVSIDVRSPIWARALTLEERAVLFPQFPQDLGTCENRARADTRVREWCARRFVDRKDFEKRLALVGLTWDSLVSLLAAEPSPSLYPESHLPRWIEDMSKLFSLPESEWTAHQGSNRNPKILFDRIWSPLLAGPVERIVTRARTLSDSHKAVPFRVESVASLFIPHILALVEEIATRTLVSEMWKAKERGDLIGSDSRACFEHFCELMSSPSAIKSLFEQYPVLARLVMESIARSADAAIEFLDRATLDWPSITELFFADGDLGPIERLDVVGDRHNQSRCVLIVTTETHRRIVYKPRSQAIAAHFQQLLCWLNERDPTLSMRTITILDRVEYGWCEFVERKDCLSTDQLPRFYERQGILLGLLYVLGCSDIHQENLIAAADQPVLVDLEALFQPPLVELMDDGSERSPKSVLADSVMRTGLLPAYFRGIQLGGLTPRGEQYTDNDEPVWANPGTVEMQLERQKKRLSTTSNMPIFDGQHVGVTGYQEEFVVGFTRVLELLRNSWSDLTASNGPLSLFSRDYCRVLLRNTMLYARMLFESYHPEVLRDSLARDEVFDHLWRVTARKPSMATVFSAECRALWSGDIPLFTIEVCSCAMGDGSETSAQITFSESGMSGCTRRLQTLNDSNIERQKWLIQAAFASTGDAPGLSTRTEDSRPDRAGGVRPEELICLASTIADRISSLCCRLEGHPLGWLSMLPGRGERWAIQPIGVDLYWGTSGLAMFLAYLGAVSGNAVYTDLARETVRAIRVQLGGRAAESLGAFDGLGGLMYVLSHLSRLWNDQDLIFEVQELAGRAASLVEKNTSLDVGEGAAGCIAGLLSAYASSKASVFLDVAISYAEQIIHHWSPTETALAGFAHGAAGISVALLDLWRETGRRDFLEKAREMIRYERALFSVEHANWPDLRQRTDKTIALGLHRYKTAWCHGATGIGLARVRTYAIGVDDLVKDEIAAAVRTTLRDGFGSNHSLCHGDMGSLELLSVAQSILRDPELGQACKRLVNGVFEDIRQNGCVCGVPGGVEVPGLMTGLAGVGYGLLRLAVPHQVPSVLMLERPDGVDVCRER